MSRRPFRQAWMVAGSTVLVALCGVGCAASSLGPVPGPASPAGPLQLSTYRSGQAHVQVAAVSGPSAAPAAFDFPLEPSAIYVSPPSRLELAFGDPAIGTGLNLQLPPEQGRIVTSKGSILTLNVRLPGRKALQATSMHGECSVTLFTVGRAEVSGRFECHRLHQNVGPGPRVAATGTFSARA